MTDELSVFQALRLKGRLPLEGLAATLGRDARSVELLVNRAVDAGLVTVAGTKFKLTPAGRQRLTELIAMERRSVDLGTVETLYDEFDSYNSELKEIITAWQMKATDVPNDHADADYDAEIVAGLADLHRRFGPWLERLAAVVPRLAQYTKRFDTAITAVQAGDHSLIAKPIVDSYHTVWFELHEELFGVLGRDRAGEAAAGRAL